MVEKFRNITPRKLTQNETDCVNGDSYRGTSVLMAVLSLYKFGTVASIKDHTGDSLRNIHVNRTFAAKTKYDAIFIGNKYLGGEYYNDENKIYNNFLRDNRLSKEDMPKGLLQPLLVAYNGRVVKYKLHQDYEGAVENPVPNSSTLYLMSSLLNMQPYDFKQQFPIISRKFIM